MTISGHKTRSVFDRYNIVSPDDLKEASTKMEAYLQSMYHGHNSKILEEYRRKRCCPRSFFWSKSNQLDGAGGGSRTRTGARPGGF